MRARSLFKIIIPVLIFVFLLEIWMVNRLATYGNKIQEIKQAKAQLELENQVLENLVAENSSLISLEEKAAHWGFDSAKNWEYIKSSQNIASVF